MIMRVFFDSEFTGIRRDTTLISIGLVAEDGNMFYAEFTDYDRSQVFDWLQENVINNLWLSNPEKERPAYIGEGKLVTCLGDTEQIRQALRQWLSQWDWVEMWADIIPFDWVLLCDLLGGIFQFPPNLSFICYDLCTLLKMKGFEPMKTNREELAGFSGVENKHNALYDALVIRACYEKLITM